jgi:benzoate membrane transport protein
MTSTKEWFRLSASAMTAVVVGFASTILLVMEAARAVGATPSQQASSAAALCFGMAVTTLILSWHSKMPMVVAWSTPGAALIATSAAGISYDKALGAYVVAGLLMAATALIAPLSRAITQIPAPIAAAMLAGVLLKYTLGVPAAALALPYYVVPLIAIFFVLRMGYALFAVPVIVVFAVIMAAYGGMMGSECCNLGMTALEFVQPQFDYAAIIGLGVPLYLVTMASQNLPGFAVLRAAGYQPPVSAGLFVTGIGGAIFAPFGAHAINMAAITASLMTGPETHPDSAQRWKAAIPYFVMYTLLGLAAATNVEILGALPKPLIIAVAGLALFSPLMGGMAAMVKEPRDIDAALVTFLVTASGFAIFNIGSAFWGLVAGVLVWGLRKLHK